MAGIGINLKNIYQGKTLTTGIISVTYNTLVTIFPMLSVIGAVITMRLVVDYSSIAYYDRDVYSSILLYIFIFSLLTCSAFNSVLSKFQSDAIYNEEYQDIRACYYVGLVMNILASCGLGIPFVIHVFKTGKVATSMICTGYCGYVSLVLVFYSMLYLMVAKDYKRISFYFFIGMGGSVLLCLVLTKLLHMEETLAMLASLSAGFFIIALLEYATVMHYFTENSKEYKKVLSYFRKYKKLVAANFLYILGLYIHNFVFWTTPERIIIADSFYQHGPYDVATFLAMMSNIPATVMMISRIEQKFRVRYDVFMSSIINGRGMDINHNKQRVFRTLSQEIMFLASTQFIITAIIYLICSALMPGFGIAGQTMRIYPSLCVGYYVVYLMYACIIYLYYYDDLTGSATISAIFCAGTAIGAYLASFLPDHWYGIGLVFGGACGYLVALKRLRWMEKNIYTHIFCRGTVIGMSPDQMPSAKIWDRKELHEKAD